MIKTFKKKDIKDLEEAVNDWKTYHKEDYMVKEITFDTGREDKYIYHYAYIWYDKLN